MEPLLKDRVSIIAGGARGIGKGVAKLFALEGSSVVIVDNDLDAAISTAEEIKNISGAQTIAIKTDVSKKAEIDGMVRKVIDKFSCYRT